MGGLDGGLPHFFDIDRMAERGESVAVVDLEDLRTSVAGAYQENSFGPGEGKDRRAPFQLVEDVFAPVADGLEPTIGFLGHAPPSFQHSSCCSRRSEEHTSELQSQFH